METIVHIGQHKTGTTSLQNFLLQNSDELIKQGIFFTDKILGYINTSHYVLNVYSLKNDRFSPIKDSLLLTKGIDSIKNIQRDLPKEIKKIYTKAKRLNCNKVIWSNEGLYLLNSKIEYEKLLNLFKHHSSTITIVCCFRDKESYRISYKKQLQKQNITDSNTFDSYRYTEEDSWLFNYDNKKKLLNNIFDRCLYWDYKSTDNITPFLDLVDIKLKSSDTVRLNETIIDKKSVNKISKRILSIIRKKIKYFKERIQKHN